MGKVLYTAAAQVEGGRAEGHGRTSDGSLEVDLRVPPELGGTEPGTNPEQLFAIGYAACFDNALAAVARRQKVELQGTSIASQVSLSTTEHRGFRLGVTLDVTLPGIEEARAVELVAAAHAVCPYSDATRGNIDIVVTANGAAVA